MKRHFHITDYFPRHLFWDMDPDNLDPRKDKDIIIPRALYATTPSTFLQDISTLEQLYTQVEIEVELRRTKEKISDKVCELVARRYDVPLFSRFRRNNRRYSRTL